MEDALAKMDEVKEMLNNMITLYKNSVYEAKLNERSKYLSAE